MSTRTGRLPPTGSTSPFLDGAEQLHLGGGRQLADLVEEQRPAGRLHELARVFLSRAGEGTLLVPEQGRFDEVLGDGAAIYSYEGSALALA
jgi:hypothetical protein